MGFSSPAAPAVRPWGRGGGGSPGPDLNPVGRAGAGGGSRGRGLDGVLGAFSNPSFHRSNLKVHKPRSPNGQRVMGILLRYVCWGTDQSPPPPGG